VCWVSADDYYIGAGRYDITGPAAEVEMMGYAMPTQTAHGIHFRQWSRAFIIADSQNKTRVVFVNADICMGSQVIKMQVVEKLQSIYGGLYTDENVLISGIHTHSGPAGYFQYVLFEVFSLGYVNESLTVIVDGIVESIKMAHENMAPGKMLLNSGVLYNASINRSPTAYELNPPGEREKYMDVGNDTDKEMLVLKMVDSSGKVDIGMIDWFAVHCTSMNNTNHLISGDNKGHASYLMEKAINGPGTLPGQGKFVAAFAQSNEGDVSPNTKGPHCQDTGKECDILHSTCDGKNELCVAAGPGEDMFDSTRIIGEKQFKMGYDLYSDATTVVSGPVDYRHMYVNMANVTLPVNGTQVHTCPPAMGYSFAAGTIDGPGAFDFTQGDTKTNPFWNFVRDILHEPSAEQIKCHAPKPILLDTGDITVPYPWQPSILPLQLLRIGQLVIIGVPAEFTTMSGRRLRETVQKVLTENGFTNDSVMVIAGLSNTYSDYVATYEEYQEQRYEAASTVYGPYTLDAYLQKFNIMAKALATGQPVDHGPDPPNYLSKQLSFLLPVVFDNTPSGKKFGDVQTDVKSQYSPNQTVEVQFWAGNPRNNLMTGKTFLTVEMQSSSGNWEVVSTDASWETRFSWYHTSLILGESLATITWDIPPDTPAGTYRIQHFGYSKAFLGGVTAYSGTSSQFKVVV